MQETIRETLRRNRPASPGSRRSSAIRSLDGDPPRLAMGPDFDLDFVKRLLGKRQGRKLSRSTAVRLRDMQERFEEIIQPRLTYQVRKLSGADAGRVTVGNVPFNSRRMAYALREARYVVLFIVTVGEGVDQEIERLMEAGALADAYVADALGSGAAENAAGRFQNLVAEQLRSRELAPGLRFSPGYCDWPVSDQEALFSLLDGGRIGVTLGETCLMHPRKSISGLFGLYDRAEAPDLQKHNPCRICAKKDCIARRAASSRTN